MALTRSLIRNAATPPRDARIMLAGLVVAGADGSPRAGVLGGANPSIVSALPSMNVAVAAAEFVTTKGRADGVAIFGNDGAVNVPIDAAPTSNSRIDVIYVKHNDDTTGDANADPIFGVAKGTAAASPAKPAIPTGALELATLRVYAGTTATNGGSNTLTNTYQMTAARGGLVAFRTKGDLDLWTNAQDGQLAIALDTSMIYQRSAGQWTELIERKKIYIHDWTMTLTSQAHKSEAVTFPSGLFSAPPRVTVEKLNGALALYIPYMVNLTKDGVTVGLQSGNNTPASGAQLMQLVAIER